MQIFDKDYIKNYTCTEKMKIIKPQEKIEGMWGLDNAIITNKDIEELKTGNLLWFSDGEYAHTISYKVGEELSLVKDKLDKTLFEKDHYKKLYSVVKEQKDELETSYDILQKNNTTLVKQKEEAYKIVDDYYEENQQLKKQKDDVVEYIKSLRIFSARNNGKTLFAKILNEILRMLGEKDD